MSILEQSKKIQRTFDFYELDNYFDKLQGMDQLSQEQRQYAKKIRQDKVHTSRISGVYSIIKDKQFRIDHNIIEVDNYRIEVGSNDDKLLKDIRSILFFMVTVEEIRKEYINITEQYYNSMWNLVALQSMRDDIIKEYVTQLEDEAKLSVILGPGYYFMELSQNKVIWELLHGEKIGVSINDHNLLQPEDTLCGMVLEYNSDNQKHDKLQGTPCFNCRTIKKNCGFCVYKEFSSIRMKGDIYEK